MSESKEVTIHGNQIDLPDDRHVWVGKGVWQDEEAESVFVEFRSGERRTRLRLSQEAANTLRYLLGAPEAPEDAIKRFLVFMTKATDRIQDSMAWKIVELDTLPVEVEPRP